MLIKFLLICLCLFSPSLCKIGGWFMFHNIRLYDVYSSSFQQFIILLNYNLSLEASSWWADELHNSQSFSRNIFVLLKLLLRYNKTQISRQVSKHELKLSIYILSKVQMNTKQAFYVKVVDKWFSGPLITRTLICHYTYKSYDVNIIDYFKTKIDQQYDKRIYSKY